MRNIKIYQQYLLFYYFSNKTFLKIVHKPMPLEALVNISFFYLAFNLKKINVQKCTTFSQKKKFNLNVRIFAK